MRCPRFNLGLILLVLLCTVQASDIEPVSIEMTPVQLSPHVYYVQGASGIAQDNSGFISNAAFVVSDEAVVVFDVLGTPSLGKELLNAIRSVSNAPIRTIYISHYHADHMYGLQAFAQTGAEIVTSEGAKEYLESEVAQQRLQERRVSLNPWVNDSTEVILPDRFLVGEEEYTIGDVQLRVVNVGRAHSEGDLVLFVETDSVLFSGDIIFEGRIPFLGTSNSDDWLNVLAEMEKVEVKAIVPGHGKIAENPQQIVSLTKHYLSFVREAMKTAVDDWIPFDEAYEATDWGEFIEYPAFAEANRRNAYGIYLSLEQESLQAQ